MVLVVVQPHVIARTPERREKELPDPKQSVSKYWLIRSRPIL